MKKLWEEFQYFFQQKIYVIILCLTAICGYGFEMTHPSIGIDDTAVSLYLEDGLEVVMGRWFIYLINKIFHLSDFSPFMMELIVYQCNLVLCSFPQNIRSQGGTDRVYHIFLHIHIQSDH